MCKIVLRKYKGAYFFRFMNLRTLISPPFSKFFESITFGDGQVVRGLNIFGRYSVQVHPQGGSLRMKGGHLIQLLNPPCTHLFPGWSLD